MDYRKLLGLLLSGLIWCEPLLSEGDKDPRKIIEYSVAALKKDWDATDEFDHSERDIDKKGDKTYNVIMLDGSPYQRLIASNNRPLNATEQSEQERKFQNAVSARRNESAEQRSRRIAKYQADRKRDHELMSELTKAFDFKLIDEEKLDGHDVYVLQAIPQPRYQPPNMDTQVLTGMQGKLWIDKKTYQWVKVEAQVIKPVSIEGFLARVEPGTRFELEKMPVGGDIWLPKHFSMESRSKILLLFPHRDAEEETYFNYRRTHNPH